MTQTPTEQWHIAKRPTADATAVEETPERLTYLSDRARESWNAMVDWFFLLVRFAGSPAKLAERMVFSREEYRANIGILRGIEVWLRRMLLLIAAADFPLPVDGALETKSRWRPHNGAGSAGHGRGGFADAPSQWQVRFDLGLAKRAQRHYRKPRKQNPPREMIDAFPFAERLEAILRVLRDPETYALRIRRRFADPKQDRNHKILTLFRLFRPSKVKTGLEQELDFIGPEAADAAIELVPPAPPD